jgi:hypothetical protein
MCAAGMGASVTIAGITQASWESGSVTATGVFTQGESADGVIRRSRGGADYASPPCSSRLNVKNRTFALFKRDIRRRATSLVTP